MPRRYLILMIGLTIMGMAAFAFLYWGAREPLNRGRLEVWEPARDIANLPHYTAAALALFPAEGLEVNLVTAPRNVIPPEGYKRADVILEPPEQAWSARRPIFIQLTKHQHGFLVARKMDDGFSWEALKGRSVVAPGPETGLQATLETILRQEKIRPQLDAVIIQNLPPHLQVGTYMAGSGSCILTTEPAAAGLELSGHGQVVASLAAAGELPGQVCAAAPRTIDKKAPELIRYTRAIAQAQEWLARHNPREVAALVAPFFPQFNHATLLSVIARGKEIDLWAAEPLPNPDHFAALQRILVESGELKAPIPYERLTRPQIATDAALPSESLH